MKLNLEILHDYLPKSYRAKLYAPKTHQLLYRRPLPYKQGSIMNPHNLYIAQASALPPRPPAGAAMVCLGGRLPQGWLTDNVQLLYLEGETDITTAMRDIFAIYDKFELWDSQLQEALTGYENLDLKPMLVCGAEMLENRIGITDGSLRQVFFCEYESDANGMVNILFRDGEFLSHTPRMEMYEGIKSVCHIERKITVPYLSSIPNVAHSVYCYNLYRFDHFMGCIHLDSVNRPFRESDFPLANHFFTYLEKAFLRYMMCASIDDSPEIRAMHNLLDHKPLHAEEYAQLALRDDEYWLCFKLNGKRGELCLPREYMCQVFNLFMPKSVYSLIHQDVIVGLFRFSHKHPDEARDILNMFAEFLRQMGYISGISNEFTDIRAIAPYLLQANYSVANSLFQATDSPLTYFRDCVLQYVLDERANEMPLESLYSKGLLALIKHDQEKGSEYMKTLNAFLLCESNVSRAAKNLFIHRSSFLKRLENIQRILDMDLEDPDIRLYLRICLRHAGCTRDLS